MENKEMYILEELSIKEAVDTLRSLRSFLIHEEFFTNTDIAALGIAIKKLEEEEKKCSGE